ncbi:hypothetical protein ACFSTE_08140 [Aquimarina hainanensis]|uniref:T9SS C-terminal target domain-containing protein n=1 Tax=Aquimarina hainanensis TaxID=1578017 RepID=A0ABW5N6Y0_9FLAO|nr:hypothetical protein [Aquimarina sp. TRL1]QKX05211.1 hypothetical protein HN014_09845 [Aquimarina sp. TRL1]
MKLSIISQVTLFLLPIFVFSQNSFKDHEMKWMKGWTNFDPNHEVYPEAEETLPTIIDSDIFLSNDITYLMSGNVYVTKNALLTIEEGTIIRCDSEKSTSLVITKGAKLIAQGSKTQPIVFTSNKSAKGRKAGDWGGIVIVGTGTINSPTGTGIIEGNFAPQYSIFGGDKDDDITTIMTYVRIEYAGQKINRSKELNGLTLYALGKLSVINNIMISHSADDSFECFGGNVKMNNLISYKAKDDDYDFTLGYKGGMKNIVAIRHPYISDSSGSYAIEIDGYDKNTGFISESSLSKVKIENAVFINLADRTNYQHTTAAIAAKNMAQLDLTNSQISGFANVIKFDKSFQSFADISKSFTLDNSVFNVHDKSVLVSYDEPYSTTKKLLQYNMFTTYFKSAKDLFTDPMNIKHPKFTLKESLGNYTVMQ